MTEEEFTQHIQAATVALERATEIMRSQKVFIQELEKQLENERISAKQQFEIIKELRRKLETGLGGRYSRST